jgi:hypothetical protein
MMNAESCSCVEQLRVGTDRAHRRTTEPTHPVLFRVDFREPPCVVLKRSFGQRLYLAPCPPATKALFRVPSTVVQPFGGLVCNESRLDLGIILVGCGACLRTLAMTKNDFENMICCRGSQRDQQRELYRSATPRSTGCVRPECLKDHSV